MLNRYGWQRRRLIHALLLLALLWSAQSANLLGNAALAAHAHREGQTIVITGHISPLAQKAMPVGRPAASMLLDHLEIFVTLRKETGKRGLRP